MRIKGFTLAEVLITLGVIGIVAALTIPPLISNYKKRSVGAKLARFYSTMNQALLMAKVENGSLEFNQIDLNDSEYLNQWYKNYVTKYIKTISETVPNSAYYKAIFIDGSGFNSYFSGRKPDGEPGLNNLYIFYCIDYSSCINGRYDGKNSFLFILKPEQAMMLTYPGTTCEKDDLERRWGCATIIKQNNWKIPDDYPIKF